MSYLNKLIVYSDMASGLLARLYTMATIARPDFVTAEPYASFLKQTAKKFPDLDFSPKMNGIEAFQKRSSEIVKALADYYATFVSVMGFTEECWKLLVEISRSIIEFRYTANVDVTSAYMNLLVKYAQLELFMQQIPDYKLCLAAFVRAYQFSNGNNTEGNWNRLVTFLKDWVDPLKKMQLDSLDTISARVGDTLMQLRPVLAKWTDCKSMITTRIFNVLDDPRAMCTPTDEKSFHDLLYLDQLKQWVLFGFLLCPLELCREDTQGGAIEVLNTVLRDTFVAPLYRDKSINIREMFYNLHDNGEFKKIVLCKKIKKPFPYFPEADKTADAHARMRTYLRVELETLYLFFKEYPSCIPPKISMIYAIVRLAREEVLWYFRTLVMEPKTPFKSKNYDPKKYIDPLVSALIFYVYSLCELVADYRRAVQEYYLEFLNSGDQKTFQPIVETFEKSNKLSTSLSDLLRGLRDALARPSVDDNFEVVRLNWYRLSAGLSLSSSGVPPKSAERLCELFTTVMQHTRNVDCVLSQLREHGSLGMLFFFKDVLAPWMKDVVDPSKPECQARHFLVLIKVLNDALLQVHRVCPEEQALIGKEAVNLADNFLRHVIANVERATREITKKTRDLRQQTSPYEVILRATGQVTEPLPGFESLFEQRKAIENLRLQRKMVSDVCAAITECETVTVYNIEFVPREFLYESIQHNVRTIVRQQAVVNQNIERPSQLLAKLKDVMYAYNHLERHVSINLCDVLQEVLLSEFCDESCGMVGEPTVRPNESKVESKATSLIHTLAQWYSQLMARDLAELGVTFSPLRKGFVSRSKKVGTDQIKADRYADINELKALCTMIGPYGVRVIDKNLLLLISENMSRVKAAVTDCQPVVSAVVGKFAERAAWQEAVGKINKESVNTLVKHSIIIGTTLRLRELLREALGEVVKERVPCIFDTVNLALMQAPEPTDPRLQALTLLAQDCGIDVKEHDFSLIAALTKFKTQQADVHLWKLLPELYGMAFISKFFYQAQYMVDSEAHTNNIHCMVHTIHALISCFHRIQLTRDNTPVEQNIQLDLEKYVFCAAQSILHITATDHTFPLTSVMMFLEQFIQCSRGRLQPAILETCFPFTVVRASYIQLSDKQTSKTSRLALGDEKEAVA